MKRRTKITIALVLAFMIGISIFYFVVYRDVPYYKGFKKPRITSFTTKQIAVTADVICFNPNKVSIKLTDSEFDVYANGKHVVETKQTYGTTISADSEFKIPLKISFSPIKVFKAKDLIGAAFLSLKKKRINLRYDGKVVVSVAGAPVEIRVDYEDYVALKK